MRYDATTIARFWSKVAAPEDNQEEACWPYMAAWFAGREYGVFRHEGKNLRSHRLAYELTWGEIPEGGMVLHSCDNPWCCNPLHLSVGTHDKNMAEGVERARFRRGEAIHRAVLTEDVVRQVRTLRSEGWKHIELAKHFGVSEGAIQGVLQGRTWKHVA